jgi:hypothetical protein
MDTISQVGPDPRCFVRAADLSAEYKQLAAENPKQVSVESYPSAAFNLAVVTKQRGNCPGFVQWYPGFSPKEHKEMLFDLERKKLEIQERESERRWQERHTARERRFQLINTLVSAFLGAAFTAILGAIAAWVISRF